MKKSWIALLLAALTTASLALPASAVSLPQPQAAAETRAQVEEYGSRPFREGLKPVLVNGVWMYMDQQSNIVDLNRGRFSYVYDFFDGLAAVIDKNTGKVGYIDKTGALTDQLAFTQASTREQFAQLIINLTEKALGKELAQAPSDTFSDTSSPAILKAYQAGIITGMGDGTFEPKTTNREQIAAMIYRAVQYMEKETGKALTPAAGSAEAFQDKAQISDWAVEGVGKLAANAIMNGTSQSTASPKQSCTVEQSILLLSLLYQKV